MTSARTSLRSSTPGPPGGPGPASTAGILARNVWTFRLFTLFALLVCLGSGLHALLVRPVTLALAGSGATTTLTAGSGSSADVLAVLSPGARPERADCLLTRPGGGSLHVGVLNATSSSPRTIDGRTWTPVAGIGRPRAGDVVTCSGAGVEALRVVTSPRLGPLMMCGVSGVAALGAAAFSMAGAVMRRRGQGSTGPGTVRRDSPERAGHRPPRG